MDERPETIHDKVRSAIDAFLSQPIVSVDGYPSTEAEVEEFFQQRLAEGTQMMLAALGLDGSETDLVAKKADPTEVAVEPMAYAIFEDNVVTAMEGVMPLVNMEMVEGYKLGTHLRFEIEARVANVRYEEGKGKRRGDFIRRHMLAPEGITVLAAFIPGEAETAVTGSLGDSSTLVEDEIEEQIEPASEIMEAPVEPEPELSLSERISAAAEAERLANPSLPSWGTPVPDEDEAPF
jgi:hypothetical protein